MYEVSARCRDLCLTIHTKHSHGTEIHIPPGIRIRNLRKRVAEDPRLRPLGHLYRPQILVH
jgi:hypothetical protein